MEKWAEIRRRVLSREISKRAACAEYGIHWDTLKKVLTHTEPPGYRQAVRRESKLDQFPINVLMIMLLGKYMERYQGKYYANINLGVNYYELNYDNCVPFLMMLLNCLRIFK